MTRRRWIADEVLGNRAALTGDHARHLAQVLRAQVGQEFDISTGAEVRRGKVINMEAGRVEFELGELISQPEQAQITVAISIFKFDRMEWAIEKCTELGVARIVPVIAGRTEKHLAGAAAKRVDRWRRVVQQAAEQSRRSSSPEIAEPIKFKELLAVRGETRILLSEVEQEVMLKDAMPQAARSALLAFGPEGGWTEQELGAFREAGWTSASLGNTILRVETAVIAGVAVALSVLR
ncbi:MAG TPA: RsmE family RNA methyltransferase [Terriglobales bacterium]|jgi:16S rRNA (uracil1498-N3)-methyltransferase|nr:RsmE family RNA methyltransferase [Terriglobales bacterium]